MTTLNVGDYGPLGTADDAPTIQAALDAAFALADPAKTTVLVPAGLYLLQQPLFIGSYTRLYAEPGTTYRRNASRRDELLRCRNVAPVYGYDGEHDWEIDGGIWDGNRPGVTDGDNIISWAHCRNVVIRNCHFTRCFSYHCVECNSTQNVLFEDCLFTDSPMGPEALQFDGAFGSGMYPWFGAYDSTACDGMTLRRCTFRDGIQDGIGSHTVVAGSPHTNLVLDDVDIHCTGIGLKLRGYRGVTWNNVRITTGYVKVELGHEGSYTTMSGSAQLDTYQYPESPPLDPPAGEAPIHMHITLYTNDGGSGQHSNLGAAVTELWGNINHRTAVDLAGFTQARLIAPVKNAGAPTCRYAVQYSADQGVTWAYLDGIGGPSIPMASTGMKVGAWVALVPEAQADVWLRPIGVDGNGSADPGVGSLYVEVR